jgi:HNH endonuclease
VRSAGFYIGAAARQLALAGRFVRLKLSYKVNYFGDGPHHCSSSDADTRSPTQRQRRSLSLRDRLPGDDLCGFPGRSERRSRRCRGASNRTQSLFSIDAARTTTSIPRHYRWRVLQSAGAFGLSPSSTTSSDRKSCAEIIVTCQSCGSRHHLQIHHRKKRSHWGDDSDSNLITLCDACHRVEHGENWYKCKRERLSCSLAMRN